MLKKVLSILMCFVLFFSVQPNVCNCVSNDEYQIKYLFMQRLNDDLSRYYEVITDGERVYINIDDLVEIANYDSSTFTTQNGKLSKILINKKNNENTSFDNSIQILPNKKIITSSWYGKNNFDGIVDFNSKIYLDIIDIFNYLRIKAEIVDGKMLVNIPVYSMLDFLIYDYQDILNNFITQMDLKTYGDGENGSNFMNTIAVAVNNFNFKFLIPVWGPMKLKKEQYIKAIQTLSEEDEAFYSPTTNGYMENQLEEKGFSKLLSSGEDLVNGMSIGGETINTYETFIDSLTNISEEQRGKYLDLVNWNGKNYDSIMDLRVWNKYAENLSNVIDISDIFVSAYEAYTRANSWTESNLKDLEVLKNLNINNYADKKEYVNRITDAASECYESANNKAEAVVEEMFEKTLELLFEKAVGVTPVGKVANYFVLAVNTGVSAAKTFPNISNKLDKAELSYIVTCLINVAIAAKIDANVKYEDFSLENLSSNDIVEFRDSIRTAIKCNLRSWYYIYYLNKDGSWEYGSEGQEVKNKINMMNTYLILLNECIQYDYSLDEYNIINFSSTEIITILNDSKIDDSLDIDTTQTYIDFLKAQEYKSYISDWIYGEPTHYSILDIDEDGIDELIITGGDGTGFYNFTVFSYDRKSKEVYPIPNVYSDVIGNEKEGYFFQNYGGLRYSPSHKALVFSELRTGSMYGGLSYFTIKNQELVSDFGIWYEYDYQTNKTTYGYSELGNRIAVDEDEYQEYLNELNESSDPEFQPIPKEGATEVSIEEYFGGDFDKKLISIRPLYDSAANAVIKIGDYNNSPDENVTWSVIYSVLNTFSERTPTSESVKHELGSAIKVNTNELVDLHNEIFANKITSLPALGSYYTDNEYSGISYSEEEDVYYFINATGGGYFGEFKDGYVLENGNAVLEFSVENIVGEHMGDCRIEITPDSGSRFGYTIVSAKKG